MPQMRLTCQLNMRQNISPDISLMENTGSMENTADSEKESASELQKRVGQFNLS